MESGRSMMGRPLCGGYKGGSLLYSVSLFFLVDGHGTIQSHIFFAEVAEVAGVDRGLELIGVHAERTRTFLTLSARALRRRVLIASVPV